MGFLKSVGFFLLDVGANIMRDVVEAEDAYERFSTFSNKRLKEEWSHRKWLSSSDRSGLIRAIKERMGR